MSDVLVTTITSCARCGLDHEVLSFTSFAGRSPSSGATHWALCPTNRHPILLTRIDVAVEDGDEPVERRAPDNVWRECARVETVRSGINGHEVHTHIMCSQCRVVGFTDEIFNFDDLFKRGWRMVEHRAVCSDCIEPPSRND